MPTTKPDKKTQPKAYRAWVRGKLLHWDPADDRGGPDTYAPRVDGILWEPAKDHKTTREVQAGDIRFSAEAAQILGRRLP